MEFESFNFKHFSDTFAWNIKPLIPVSITITININKDVSDKRYAGMIPNGRQSDELMP